jgi:hemolysin activation/secretion protein
MKPLLAALLAVASPLAARAAEPVVPGAGTILRQVQPAAPAVPSSSGTGLTVEQEDGGKSSASAPFLVKVFHIAGNTLFDTPTLHALVVDGEGTSLTFAQLSERVARITGYYRSHGYPLARAILPVQAVRSGVVRIEVIEARYSEVRFENSSRVNDALLDATLSPVKNRQAIRQTTLDHSLLLLSDIPGTAVTATLKPGDDTGTSDLVVNVAPGQGIEGNVVLDNYGNRYTGEAHIGVTVNSNNPLHHGDVLSASALSSGSGLNYGSLAYNSLLNGRGTRMGGSYSALRYSLGGSLDPLDARGTAQVASVWTMQPLVRSRKVSVYGLIQYDRLKLRDRIDSGAIRTDRHLGNATVSLSGDVRDGWLSQAVSTWNVGWTWGRVGFDDEAAQSADGASARTQGRFSKWTVSVSRLQELTATDALYLAFRGQWATDNLDASDKMIAGGPYTVRGYDMGAICGDSGYQGTVELRHDLDFAWMNRNQYQAVLFMDSAHLTLNETPWMAGTNGVTVNGAGVGLYWAGSNQWAAKMYVATRIGPAPEVAARNASTRAWAEISKGF